MAVELRTDKRPRRWAHWLGGIAFAAVVACGPAGGQDEDIAAAGSPDQGPPVAPPGAYLFPEVLSASYAAEHDGVWFVLDYRSHRIHRIASGGTYLGSFGGHGEGPGELRGNTGLVTVHGDSIVVRDRWGIHLYRLDGTPVADRRVEDDHCFAPQIVGMASAPSGLLLAAHCSGRSGANPAPRVILGEGGGPARTLVTDTADTKEVRWDRGFARMAGHPRGFVFGYMGDECLGLFDFEGAPLERICHDWLDRVPLPKELADEYMADIVPRARDLGMRVHRPESYPPFIEFFATSDGDIVYLARVSQESPRGVRLLARGRAGGQIVLPIPPANSIVVSGTTALAAWDEPEGTRIQFYSLDIEGGGAEPVAVQRPRQ